MENWLAKLTKANTSIKRLPPQRIIVAILLFIFGLGAILLSQYGWRQSVLFAIGGLLGMTLYHASFGFASAYRQLILQRDGRGIYAQLLMLTLATVLFAPILASGSIWGQTVKGSIAPVGLQGAIGAFLFGIGMQLGGACGCGTLYTIGGGNVTMLLTLLTFSIGAFGASLTRQLWVGLPATDKPIVLGTSIGWIQAVLLQLLVFAGLVFLLRWWGKGKAGSRTQELELPRFQTQELPSFLSIILRGPWSLFMGAISLAVLNWITLIISGQPWRITWGFALWSAKLATYLGWDSSSSPFWGNESAQQLLTQGIFADVSSVMNLGIILGAFFAAALAGRWSWKGQLTVPKTVGALLGGSIMGYSAFLAAGCNVNAFFGGIASTSLHGWVWIVCALFGTLIGVRLRPLFHPD